MIRETAKKPVQSKTKKKSTDQEDVVYFVSQQDEQEVLRELVPRNFGYNEWSNNDY